ncbi:MAG: hypothetical protein C0617_03690 [Desulfuromonas sp.]|uniref:patatin-like phospholipase family protein n=1 Tax=Desulfuromonas sp. TaxID=892 RepID=UPI000CC77C4A|nr:patatin-like phospholipase family protein [Desulfuromonas sp.]PLX85610.1 MAG: hypothetical protein C0617_03690 [Desulfuromonas sp.]
MTQSEGKTALVLAGGGIMGAAYEIGCLTALERLFAPGFSTGRFDMFVGVSAGAVIAALLANRIPPSQLFEAIAREERSVFNFRRSDIYRIDLWEVLGCCGRLAINLPRILWHFHSNRLRLSGSDLFHVLQEQFPAGLFSLGPMQNYLCHSFRTEGIRDAFHLIDPELYIPAYDLDRGERVVFGSEGFRDVHICQAITASSAIPFFFRPHKVGEHYYLDGSTGRVTHLDVALEQGAKLIVVFNPRVPMANDMERACLPSLSLGKCSSIADLGITFAWEQARRIENKEKLDLALAGYRREHPEVDILLIEPPQEESLLFFQSPMSHTARHHVMNHGYHLTLGHLRDLYGEFRQVFARHGIPTTDAHLDAAPPAEVAT